MKQPTDFIYGVDERTVKEVLLFDEDRMYQPFDDINTTQLELCVCGCARNYLDKFQFVAPLIPYGVLVRRKDTKTMSLQFEYPVTGLESVRTPPPFEIGVYKQKKGDKEILSIGISSDVFNQDVVTYYSREDRHMYPGTPRFDLVGSLVNSASRESNKLIKTPEGAGGVVQLLGFLRTGVKKPDYVGAAHIGAPYARIVGETTEVHFTDDNYQFMGWFQSHELMDMVYTQEALKDIKESMGDKYKDVTHRFSNPETEAKLRPLMDYEFENWSEALLREQYLDVCIENAIDKHYNKGTIVNG